MCYKSNEKSLEREKKLVDSDMIQKFKDKGVPNHNVSCTE